uniref:plasmid mobilization protein n=1 Tax=Bacteroides intestinalis TaxID=329854 RepID=UPI0022E79DA3
AKKRIEKQQRVVSTKLTELQYYAIRKRAGEAGLRVSEYVRQAVVSVEVIPRLNRQDADTIRKLAGSFALVAVELVKLKNRIIEIINHLSDDWKNKKGKRV